MADVTIGGDVFHVSLPNFRKLKAAWRHIGALQASGDPMQSVEAILGVVAVGSATPVTQEALEEALTPAEMPALRGFIDALIAETGLAGEPDAAGPLAPPSPSTATSDGSSTSSSRPAAEA